MDRRQVILGLTATPVALASSGCLFLLLRLVVGRGAAGLLSRAARVGGTRAAATFGRGVSVGSLASRQAMSRAVARGATPKNVSSRTVVLRKDGTEVATTHPEGNGTYTRIRGSDVLFSREMPYGHVHRYQGVDVGRSIRKSSDRVEHQDSKQNTISFDRVRLVKNIIEHYNSDGGSMGETSFIQSNSNIEIVSSDEALEAYSLIEKDLGFHCPGAKDAYDKLSRAVELCREKDIGCGQVGFKDDLYRRLKDC